MSKQSKVFRSMNKALCNVWVIICFWVKRKRVIISWLSLSNLRLLLLCLVFPHLILFMFVDFLLIIQKDPVVDLLWKQFVFIFGKSQLQAVILELLVHTFWKYGPSEWNLLNRKAKEYNYGDAAANSNHYVIVNHNFLNYHIRKHQKFHQNFR